MLFLVLMIGSLSIPFPTNVLVIAAGSFVAQGEMELGSLIAVLMSGSIIGDNLGFALGRWGGKRLVRRLTLRFGVHDKFVKAEEVSRKWGASGIFFTRWLVSSLAPFVNVTCGLTEFPWPRFLFWEVLGQALWVSIYVSLGYFFSDRVQDVGEFVGDLSGAITGAALTLLLGWILVRQLKADPEEGPT